jgi:uncharacterized protein (TIGR00290 family)
MINPMEKVLFSWSSGKDSALALYELQRNKDYEIIALLTTVTAGYERISMHGVRRELLEQQAAALGYPLTEIVIPQKATNEEYEDQMRRALAGYQEKGVNCVAFGDIFLEDLRAYREKNLAQVGMRGIFPLWKRDTRELVHELGRLGFKAIITCVDTQALGKEYAGREINEKFLEGLPEKVDPCGENGEFHTFVYDGPNFSSRIAIAPGEKVLREDRFYYCDLKSR